MFWLYKQQQYAQKDKQKRGEGNGTFHHQRGISSAYDDDGVL